MDKLLNILFIGGHKAIVNGFCDAIVLNSVKPFDKLLNNLDKFSPSTADCVFDESSKYSSLPINTLLSRTCNETWSDVNKISPSFVILPL